MNGLVCPKCGCRDLRQGPAWMISHTQLKKGFIRRYRVCRNCGYRIRTKEKIDQAV